MHLLWLIFFGFVVGLIARALMPGPQPMGFIKTSLLGIAGSFVGGLLTSFFFSGHLFGGLHAAGFVGSVIGAMIVLAIGGASHRRLVQ